MSNGPRSWLLEQSAHRTPGLPRAFRTDSSVERMIIAGDERLPNYKAEHKVQCQWGYRGKGCRQPV